MAFVIAAVFVLALPAGAGPNCKCRANGQKYAQGQVLCIRSKLMRCDMQLNNSSWKVVAPSCPQSILLPGDMRLPHSSLPELAPPRS
ncbi:MAG: hypothetical protein HYX36_08590 [Rhizobiales bacterium]|nr:hypothetical protein [Hyphomicrobiales bacterium]